VKLLVLLSLVWPILMLARLAWRRLHLATTSRAESLVLAPPPPEVHAALARFALSADFVVDAPPPLDTKSLLAAPRPAAPPTIDFSLIGVAVDRDVADQATWRAAQRALASRRS
jgi:hypothetical protein